MGPANPHQLTLPFLSPLSNSNSSVVHQHTSFHLLNLASAPAAAAGFSFVLPVFISRTRTQTTGSPVLGRVHHVYSSKYSVEGFRCSPMSAPRLLSAGVCVVLIRGRLEATKAINTEMTRGIPSHGVKMKEREGYIKGKLCRKRMEK